MTAASCQGHGLPVALLDLVQRSLDLGAWPELADGALPVEIVDSTVEATAEGYITRITLSGEAARVELVLDDGLPGQAKLSAFNVEWRGLREHQIVSVRLDPLANA
jgi:hypothetical protein